MTEQTKAANLLEEIKEAQKQKTISASITAIGCVIIVGGIVLNIEITGIFFFLIIYGIYVFVHNTHKSNKLMKELEKIIVLNPTCTNCKKELPKGNFDFCPFAENQSTLSLSQKKPENIKSRLIYFCEV